MSNTLRAEVLAILTAAEKPLALAQVWAERTRPATYASLRVTVCRMADNGQINKLPAPKNCGSGTKWVYGPGSAPINDDYGRGPTKREHKGFMQLKREREAKERGRLG